MSLQLLEKKLRSLPEDAVPGYGQLVVRALAKTGGDLARSLWLVERWLAGKKAGPVNRLKELVKGGSYFENCPRDDSGHCKPKGGGEAGGGDKPSKGSTDEVESGIREALSSSENRDLPYQKYRQVHLPDEFKLLPEKIAPSVPEGEARMCYVNALAKASQDEKHQLYVGVLVDKKELVSKDDPPDAVKHAWTVINGKIHDDTIGSERAKNYHYLGEKVDPATFDKPQALQDYVAGKVKAGEERAQNGEDEGKEQKASKPTNRLKSLLTGSSHQTNPKPGFSPHNPYTTRLSGLNGVQKAPCEQGQTAAHTGCTPASGGGTKKPGQEEGETSKQKLKLPLESHGWPDQTKLVELLMKEGGMGAVAAKAKADNILEAWVQAQFAGGDGLAAAEAQLNALLGQGKDRPKEVAIPDHPNLKDVQGLLKKKKVYGKAIVEALNDYLEESSFVNPDLEAVAHLANQANEKMTGTGFMIGPDSGGEGLKVVKDSTFGMGNELVVDEDGKFVKKPKAKPQEEKPAPKPTETEEAAQTKKINTLLAAVDSHLKDGNEANTSVIAAYLEDAIADAQGDPAHLETVAAKMNEVNAALIAAGKGAVLGFISDDNSIDALSADLAKDQEFKVKDGKIVQEPKKPGKVTLDMEMESGLKALSKMKEDLEKLGLSHLEVDSIYSKIAQFYNQFPGDIKESLAASQKVLDDLLGKRLGKAPDPKKVIAGVDTSSWPEDYATDVAKGKLDELNQAVKSKTVAQHASNPDHFFHFLLSTPDSELGGNYVQVKQALKKAYEAELGYQAKTQQAGTAKSTKDWKHVGPQKGSNPGGQFEDENGIKHYVKFSKSESHAKAEVLASKLYQLAGSGVINSDLVDTPKGIGSASVWQDDLKPFDPNNAQHLEVASQDWGVHCWLGNWDAVGMNYDNQAWTKDGKLITNDVGGSLMYKAQGEGKPFGPEVDELKTMAGEYEQTGKVFGGMTPQQKLKALQKVAGIGNDAIAKMVEECGPGDAKAKAQLTQTLIERKNKIKAAADDLAKSLGAGEAPKTEIAKMAVSIPAVPMFSSDYHKKKVQVIYEAAASGDPAALDAIYVNPENKNSHNLKIHKYKMACLAALKGGVQPPKEQPKAAEVKPGPFTPPAGKINPKEFPAVPEFVSSDKANVEANNKAVAEMTELAKKGDLTGLEAHPGTGSPKVQAYKQELYAKVNDQLNPPPPPKPYSGELDNLKKVFKNSKDKGVSKKLGEYIITEEPGVPDVQFSRVDLTSKKTGYSYVLQDPQQAEAHDQGYNKLSDKSRKLFWQYTGKWSGQYNSDLHSGMSQSDAAELGREMIEHAPELPVGTYLCRKIDLLGKDLADIQKSAGMVLQEPAFSSTSINDGHWHGNVWFHMTAGPGVKGLWAGTKGQNKYEEEIVLPPGARYLVKSVKKGSYRTDVEVILLPTVKEQCC